MSCRRRISRKDNIIKADYIPLIVGLLVFLSSLISLRLGETIGVKVDLLTEGAVSVSPYLIDRIKSELRVIYQ